MEGYIYLIQSEKDGTYYFGSTKDVSLRLFQHNQGKSSSTRKRCPWKLIHTVKFDSIARARSAEQNLKSKKKKISLAWFLEGIALLS